jgi:phosphoglycerate dehydrogenase-like enzyme
MALPGTAETEHILNRERIALLPQNAYVINVGRGSAIDQEALMDALNHDQLAGAALDVFVPEPLPEDHPLWETKNLIVTPHISGNLTLGYTRDINVAMFCEDLANYAAGRPLKGLVDRKLGY